MKSFWIVWLVTFIILNILFFVVSVAIGLATVLGDFTLSWLFDSASWRGVWVVFAFIFAFVSLGVAMEVR